MNTFDFFSGESIYLHNTPEQVKRQHNRNNVNFISIDYQACTAQFRTRENNKIQVYEASLYKCQCVDFASRKLPCKHMYKLADDLGAYRLVANERSKDLIADFSSGYANGWAFVVRPCNFLELDILYSNKDQAWTQGNFYNFQQGDIFYSDILAYQVPWEDALKSLRYSIQIDDVTSSFAGYDILYEDIPQSNSAITPRKGIVRRYVTHFGVVSFSLYTPNKNKTTLKKVRSLACQQNQFIELLKTGDFVDTNGERQSIFNLI